MCNLHSKRYEYSQSGFCLNLTNVVLDSFCSGRIFASYNSLRMPKQEPHPPFPRSVDFFFSLHGVSLGFSVELYYVLESLRIGLQNIRPNIPVVVLSSGQPSRLITLLHHRNLNQGCVRSAQ